LGLPQRSADDMNDNAMFMSDKLEKPRNFNGKARAGERETRNTCVIETAAARGREGGDEPAPSPVVAALARAQARSEARGGEAGEGDE